MPKDDAMTELEEQIRAAAKALCESIELEKLEKQLELFNRTVLHKSRAIITLKQQLDIINHDMRHNNESNSQLVSEDLLLSSLLQAVSYLLANENGLDYCINAKVKQLLVKIINSMSYKSNGRALLVPGSSLLSSVLVVANFLNEADTYYNYVYMSFEESVRVAFDSIVGGFPKIRTSVESLIIACNSAKAKEVSSKKDQKLSPIEQQLLVMQPDWIGLELVLLHFFCMQQQSDYTRFTEKPSDEQLYYVLKSFIGQKEAKAIIPNVADGLEKTLDISKDDKLNAVLNTLHNNYIDANPSKFTNDFSFMPSLIIVKLFLIEVNTLANNSIGSNEAVHVAFDSISGGLPSIRDSLETLIQASDKPDSSKEAVQQLLAIRPQLLELEKALPLFVMETSGC